MTFLYAFRLVPSDLWLYEKESIIIGDSIWTISQVHKTRRYTIYVENCKIYI